MRHLHLAVKTVKTVKTVKLKESASSSLPNSNSLSSEHRMKYTGAVRKRVPHWEVRSNAPSRMWSWVRLHYESAAGRSMHVPHGRLLRGIELHDSVSHLLSQNGTSTPGDSLPTLSALANSSAPPKISSTCFCLRLVLSNHSRSSGDS